MIASLSVIGQQLTSILDLDGLLPSVLDLAIENVRAERGILFLRDETTSEMIPALARGMDRERLEEVASFSRSVVNQVALGKTVLNVDVGKDPVLSAQESVILHEIKSILCVPMRSRGTIIGVIYLDTRRARQLFTAKERAFVESFASQAGVAIENARLFGRMNGENERLRREVEGRGRFESLIGTSPAMQRLTETIGSILDSECNILICGESGTGKELVARAIHFNGPRRDKKLMAIDCGALPESLLEAELFGCARGAFTGADRDRAGLIEQATGGSLFLDEITNTSLALQARLLRVLQEREVRRLGETTSRHVDVRILAATNADIKQLMTEGRFRQDLYYRLNVVRIDVPPLHDRRADIPLLAAHFLQAHAKAGRPARQMGPGVADLLQRYDWPGNVRELQNVIERLVLLAPRAVITISDLPEGIRPPGISLFPQAGAEDGLGGDGAGKSKMERGDHRHKTGEQMMIEEALYRFGGDKAKAARFIGWNRQKMYRRIKAFGIPADYGKAA